MQKQETVCAKEHDGKTKTSDTDKKSLKSELTLVAVSASGESSESSSKASRMRLMQSKLRWSQWSQRRTGTVFWSMALPLQFLVVVTVGG